MFWNTWHNKFKKKKPRKKREPSGPSSSQLIWEAKNFGEDFIVQKHGQNTLNKIASKLEKSTRTPGRSGGSTAGGGRTRFVRGRGMVKVGSSKANAPKRTDASKHNPVARLAVGGRFGEGGEVRVPNTPPVEAPTTPGSTFRPRLKLNLENDDELAQGSHHEWAQPTSVSSTITGLLRQAQNAAPNYWDQWAQDKTGVFALNQRQGGSSMGVDMQWWPETQTAAQQASNNPFGAFGVQGVFTGGFRQQAVGQPNNGDFNITNAADPNAPATPPTSNDPNSPDFLPPSQTTGKNNPVPGHATPPPPANANPWAYGYGGESNSYGPNPVTMAQGTMEALSLANAYFAPQRMELAYELGDMETDMRRLAVNLGRQVDDPVLQAKLYKEAARSVRTLDIQQNTFAFQMAEQRRREDLQNFQFYDQLAQEEYRLRLQNMQFYEQLDLQNAYFNLQRYNVAHPPTVPPPITSTTPGTTTTTQPQTPGAARSPFLIQNQFPGMGSTPVTPQAAGSLAGLGGNLVGLNPYAAGATGGGALVNRSRYTY